MSIQNHNSERSSGGTTNPSWRYTAAYYNAFLILGITTASLGPTLPGLAAQLQLPLKAVSSLFIARSAGYLIGSVLGGRLFDRFRGHMLLAGALVVMTTGMAVVPALPVLGFLAGVFFAIGFSEGSVDVGTNTILVWTHRINLGGYLNGLHFFFGLGAFIAPLIIGWVISVTEGISWAYWVLALLALPAAIWIGAMSSPPRREISERQAGGQIRWLVVILSGGLLFLYVSAEAGFGGWIFTYTQAQTGWGTNQAALMTSAFWGALTIGRLFAVPLAGRMRPSTILKADFSVCLASLAILGFFPIDGWAIWVAALGLGLGMASIFPTTVALVERRLGLSGKVTGWLFVGAGLGGMFLPWFIGQFFESVGPGFMTLAISTDMVAGFGLLLLLLQISEPRQTVVEPV